MDNRIHNQKGNSPASNKQNYFLSRENETVTPELACAQLEPRQQEHAHVVTIRLGYGGVIWCAEKPPPFVGLATGALEKKDWDLLRGSAPPGPGRINAGLVLARSTAKGRHIRNWPEGLRALVTPMLL